MTSLYLIDGCGYVDPIRFEQILANYLSNAGKYCSHSKNIIIRMEEKENVYRISVINSGQAYGCYNEENNVVFWFEVIKVV